MDAAQARGRCSLLLVGFSQAERSIGGMRRDGPWFWSCSIVLGCGQYPVLPMIRTVVLVLVVLGDIGGMNV